MTRAFIRTTMLTAPLLVGAWGCTTSKTYLPSSGTKQAGLQTELSSERLMAIGRVLERQGRTAQAKRVYASVALRDGSPKEAAHRAELLAAHQEKRQGLTASQQIAKHTPPDGESSAGRPKVPAGAAQAPQSTDANFIAGRPVSKEPPVRMAKSSPASDPAPWQDDSPHSSPGQPPAVLQPPAGDISRAAVTGEEAASGERQCLVEVVATADHEVRQLVAALNELRPLVQKLEDADPAVRRDAVKDLALKGADAKPVLPVLAKRLSDVDTGVRVQAARAIWEIDEDDEQVVPALSDLVGDRHAAVCCMAAFLLGEIGPKAAEALPALRRVLPHTSGVVRVHVAEAIARIDPQDSSMRSVLAQSLADADSDVRWLAVCALESAASAGDLHVVDKLTGALGDRDPRVRAAAALTLSAFGPSAKRALPSLRNAVKEDDPRVREAAAIALAGIDLGQPTNNQ